MCYFIVKYWYLWTNFTWKNRKRQKFNILGLLQKHILGLLFSLFNDCYKFHRKIPLFRRKFRKKIVRFSVKFQGAKTQGKTTHFGNKSQFSIDEMG